MTAVRGPNSDDCNRSAMPAASTGIAPPCLCVPHHLKYTLGKDLLPKPGNIVPTSSRAQTFLWESTR